MSGLDPDAINGGKGGVSYPPNLADAKEETPNGTNGIPYRTIDIDAALKYRAPDEEGGLPG